MMERLTPETVKGWIAVLVVVIGAVVGAIAWSDGRYALAQNVQRQFQANERILKEIRLDGLKRQVIELQSKKTPLSDFETKHVKLLLEQIRLLEAELAGSK